MIRSVIMTILITTFQTWLPHQASNSADDLIAYLDQTEQLPIDCHCLRHVPVDFNVAPRQVIAKIAELRPRLVLCCGMAESRSQLSIEGNGYFQSDYCFTSVPLKQIVAQTQNTVISQDAGRFVCNHLYYQVLRHLASAGDAGTNSPIPSLFIHVPLLDQSNIAAIAADFLTVLNSCSKLC
jgi:pyroglutamyl-peptidase